MIINHQQHINLLQKEYQYRILEWEKTLNQYAAKLWETRELLLCHYLGFDSNRGNILLRFKTAINFPPRKNEYFTCFLSQFQNEHVQRWGGLQYKDLRDKQLVKFDGKVVFIQYEGGTSIVGVSGATEEQVAQLKKEQLIFLGPSDPPLHYLHNLIEHLKNSVQTENNILSLKITQPNWNPQPISVNEDMVANLQVDMLENEISIIQGSPGTGKTYRIANFIRAVVNQGFSVMVTAMTNRALVEVAEKEQMVELLQEGKVFKTNLSASEQANKNIKGINPLRKINIDQPPVLLTSYYTMSNIAMNAIEADYFDYVIIEEASQAYLATISLARKVGKKTIVIGDKEQLPPIFHKTHPVDNEHGYYWMVNGLSAISNFLNDTSQYILNDSFRLSPAAVARTNAFYNGILNSVSSIEFPLSQSTSLYEHFDSHGGVKLCTLNYQRRIGAPKTLKDKLYAVIESIFEHSEQSSIAILAYNRDTVRTIANVVFTKYHDPKYNILVDTIDRVQGLTVDFTIFLIPMEAYGGALDRNRFNVATSRARKGTLIISDFSVEKAVGVDVCIDMFFNNGLYSSNI
jgi:hypothetical protein